MEVSGTDLEARVFEGDPEAAAEARQMPTDDLLRRSRLIDNEVRVLKVRWLLPGVVPLPRASSCPNPHLSAGVPIPPRPRATHLVPTELHAGQVVPLGEDLDPGGDPGDLPPVDGGWEDLRVAAMACVSTRREPSERSSSPHAPLAGSAPPAP